MIDEQLRDLAAKWAAQARHPMRAGAANEQEREILLKCARQLSAVLSEQAAARPDLDEEKLTGTERDNLGILGEALHTGWRKGVDHPYAAAIWKLIQQMRGEGWGDYLFWVHDCLGQMGYRPDVKERQHG